MARGGAVGGTCGRGRLLSLLLLGGAVKLVDAAAQGRPVGHL